MRKLDKFFKNLKKIKKFHIVTKYFPKYPKFSFMKSKQFTNKALSKSNYLGNIEFGIFFSGVFLCIYYIHKNRKHFGETTRLIAAGISTHIVVDSITYFLDIINTKVKIESFYKKKDASFTKDVNYFFDKKFSHFKQIIKRKRNISQKSLGHYLGDLHPIGLQAAIVFITINSVVFYGLYKNLKFYLKEKFGINGFSNFFLAAGIGQLVAMSVSFPLENIKTRMQAGNFSYDSFFKYYKKLIKGKSLVVILQNIKIEYSGFYSHLILYVVYESLTFAIYETIMDLKFSKTEEHVKENINFYQVLMASALSGLIAAVITNPIDVYQVNKQVNPKFQFAKENMLIGMKERIYFITFLNILTFFFLETIGPKYFDVRLE